MAEEVVTAAPVAASPVTEAVVPVSPVVTDSAPEAAVVTSSPEGAASGAETPVVAETPKAEPAPLLNPEEAPKAEAPVEAPKAEPAPLPVYEFRLPEGTKADNPAFKSFQGKLAEFQNLSKAEQAVVQKFGQDMIDMHLDDMKSVVESQNKSAWDWFNNRNKEWLDAAKADTQIGGDNFNQTVTDATRAISLYGGTKAQQIETARLLQETGVENSPVMLRFLSNITKIAAKEGTPVTSQNTPVQKTGIAQAMYGGKKGAA